MCAQCTHTYTEHAHLALLCGTIAIFYLHFFEQLNQTVRKETERQRDRESWGGGAGGFVGSQLLAPSTVGVWIERLFDV